MSEIRKILGEFSEDEDVVVVTPNLVYLERQYDNWAEKPPDIWLRASEEGRGALSVPEPRARRS
jgi:hypothetical protein